MTSDTVTDLHHFGDRPLGWVDEINWTLHVAIADKLRLRPQLLGIALENLRAWKPTADAATRLVLRRWKLMLLSSTPEEVADFLIDRSKDAALLRRDSPFCGVLTPEEQRLALLRAAGPPTGNDWPVAA